LTSRYAWNQDACSITFANCTCPQVDAFGLKYPANLLCHCFL
jgi:26S proteasome regulatory subunit N12